MHALEVKAAWDAGLCRIALVGEARLDTIPRFDEVAQDVETRAAQRVLVDLAGVTFMDSASTGSLLRMHQRAGERGGLMVLYGLPRRITRLFERLGLDETFVIAADEAEALRRGP